MVATTQHPSDMAQDSGGRLPIDARDVILPEEDAAPCSRAEGPSAPGLRGERPPGDRPDAAPLPRRKAVLASEHLERLSSDRSDAVQLQLLRRKGEGSLPSDNLSEPPRDSLPDLRLRCGAP